METAACLPHVNQPPFLVVQTEHDRSKMSPAAFRLGVSADDALDSLANLDLQPFAGAAFFVEARAFLRDDALESRLLRHLEQRLAVVFIVIRISNGVAPQ